MIKSILRNVYNLVDKASKELNAVYVFTELINDEEYERSVRLLYKIKCMIMDELTQ